MEPGLSSTGINITGSDCLTDSRLDCTMGSRKTRANVASEQAPADAATAAKRH